MIDRIAVATGPAHGNLFTSDRLLSNMKQSGLAHDDPLDFGIEVDGMGRAINQTATAEQNLFVASPLARGMFGELVGVPDLSYHAQNIATAIAELLQLGHHRTAEQQK